MLFEPLQVGKLTLPNRIVLSALDLAYCPDGQVNERLIRFYEERARGGAGLVMIGGTAIDAAGVYGGFVSIHSDDFINGHRQLARRVKQQGARVGIQLFHSGAYSLAYMTGQDVVAPSPVVSGLTGHMPRELSHGDIQELVARYARAARRAREAGYDIIEVISSAGYLINQFLSPLTNRRSDGYGGSPENRMRFGLEVMAAIRKEAGDDAVLSVRLGGNDFVPGSNTWKEMGLFARALQDASVNLANVTGGWHQSRIPQIQAEVPRGTYTYLARKIKEQVQIPVAAGNRINNPQLAETVLRSGQADLVSVARGFLADPEWGIKARTHRSAQIRKCIACMTCLDSVFIKQGDLAGVVCAVNPQAGFEATRPIHPARKAEKVLVVGGGPAGLEAARTAALKGHQVVLGEKSAHIGGQWRLASVPPGKEEFASLLDYYQEVLPLLGVDIRTGFEANVEAVKAANPDTILVATGARPAAPFIPTQEGSKVMTAWEVLEGKPVPGDRIVVVGGGATGCETAIYLAEQGTLKAESLRFLMLHRAEEYEVLHDLLTRGTYQVALVEREKGLARDLVRGARWATLKHLRALGVDCREETRVTAIRPGEVEAECQGRRCLLPADTVVFALGVTADNLLYQQLRDHFDRVFLLGDAAGPAQLIDAIHGAFQLTNQVLN